MDLTKGIFNARGILLHAILPLFIFTTLITQTFSQWEPQSSGSEYLLYSVYFIDNSTGFVGSRSNNLSQFIGGQIIRTSNGGQSWQQVFQDTNLRVGSFHFINSTTGFVVGGSYSILGRIFKTTNAGLNWQNATPASINSFLYNIKFLNDQTGYIGAISGVFKSTDAGSTWAQIFSVTYYSINFNKISFADVNTGYYLCDSGSVYKTNNAGVNWQQVRSGGEALFFDIEFTDANTGYISGEAGRLYRTVDGGSTWQSLTTGNTGNQYGIFFTDLNTGYVTGQQFAYKTVNGGNSWANMYDAGGRTLWGVYFNNANTGYMVSDTGKVYKTTTGGVIGITNISGIVPKDFSLGQNYPNPFNPTTNIKFAIPRAAFVKLAVYDMLGREVESLVSQQLTAGSYVVDWNASKFSSGIYMYKLTTNDFSMVKKMSLIK